MGPRILFVRQEMCDLVSLSDRIKTPNAVESFAIEEAYFTKLKHQNQIYAGHRKS